MQKAIQFEADIVYSSAVAFHVHPYDQHDYITDLLRLTHKPGSVLIVDTKLGLEEFRFDMTGWIRPAKAYIEALAPLKLLDLYTMQTVKYDGHRASSTILVFQRS